MMNSGSRGRQFPGVNGFSSADGFARVNGFGGERFLAHGRFFECRRILGSSQGGAAPG